MELCTVPTEILKSSLSPISKIILTYMLNNVDSDFVTTQNKAKICSILRVSHSTFERAIGELESGQYLQKFSKGRNTHFKFMLLKDTPKMTHVPKKEKKEKKEKYPPYNPPKEKKNKKNKKIITYFLLRRKSALGELGSQFTPAALPSADSEQASEPAFERPLDPKAAKFRAAGIVLAYWNSKRLRTHKQGTKYHGKALREINAILHGKHDHVPRTTIKQFRIAIDRFDRACNDPSCYPRKKTTVKRQGIIEFCWNEFRSFSYLSQFVKAPPKPITVSTNRELTRKLMAKFAFEMYAGTIEHIDKIDRPLFAKTTNRIMQFIDENRTHLNVMFCRSNEEIVNMYWEAVLRSVGHRMGNVRTTYLPSDLTFKHFKDILKQQGVYSPTVRHSLASNT